MYLIISFLIGFVVGLYTGLSGLKDKIEDWKNKRKEKKSNTDKK